eukprot:12387753-Alexandrium_andersonii.AAC.1
MACMQLRSRCACGTWALISCNACSKCCSASGRESANFALTVHARHWHVAQARRDERDLI